MSKHFRRTSCRVIWRKFLPSNPAADSHGVVAAGLWPVSSADTTRGQDYQTARRAVATESVSQKIQLFDEQFGQLLWLSYRCFAREIFAYVGRWFSVDHRHGANGFVFLAEKFLAVAAIGQKQYCLWQKMATDRFEQRLGFRSIFLPGTHNLTRLA